MCFERLSFETDDGLHDVFVELSNDSSVQENRVQSSCRYDLSGVDGVEGDVVVKENVTADVVSNVLSKIPCDDVDDDTVWDEYDINVDVKQKTDCAFPSSIQTLDGALSHGGYVPVSKTRVVNPISAPDCFPNLSLESRSTEHVMAELPKLLTDPSGPSDHIDTSTFTSDMLDIYARVFKSGDYNFRTARIPLPSGLNTANWELFLRQYHDREIVEFLKYGWPSDFNHNNPLLSTLRNHSSGISSDSHIQHFIDTELSYNAILGPFDKPPIIPMHISPIMTRPKKNSEKRRIVVDLSWPRSMSVNDGIPINEYLGKPINLTLPTIDYMSSRVRELGRGCYLYKLDLSRGYRQLRLDPLDWPIMSIRHRGDIYMDLCPPFGLWLFF